MTSLPMKSTSNIFGVFKCGQYGSGGWSPWSNWDCPIATFFRPEWKVNFYVIYERIEDEERDALPRSRFTLSFDHGCVFAGANSEEVHNMQVEAALWVREHASLLESCCQPVLKAIIDQYVNVLMEKWIDPEFAPNMERQLKERGFGTPEAVFRMTHPCSVRFFAPQSDGRVLYSLEFDWSCDEDHYPVLYFHKERLITHNHLPEEVWKGALAAEGLPGYRSSIDGR